MNVSNSNIEKRKARLHEIQLFEIRILCICIKVGVKWNLKVQHPNSNYLIFSHPNVNPDVEPVCLTCMFHFLFIYLFIFF